MKYNSGNMPNILNSIDHILLESVAFDKFSMIACQSIGFNGIKRKHRRSSRYLFNCALKLENDGFDNSQVKLMNNFPQITYDTSDIMNHLEEWTEVLDIAISKLGELNNSYLEQTGISCGVVEKAIKHMVKTREKTRRWHNRFMKTETEHDKYILDDLIHTKEKMKEDMEIKYWYK